LHGTNTVPNSTDNCQILRFFDVNELQILG